MSKIRPLTPLPKNKDADNNDDMKRQKQPQCPIASGMIMAKSQTIMTSDRQSAHPVILTLTCMGSRCSFWDHEDNRCLITSALKNVKQMKRF